MSFMLPECELDIRLSHVRPARPLPVRVPQDENDERLHRERAAHGPACHNQRDEL